MQFFTVLAALTLPCLALADPSTTSTAVPVKTPAPSFAMNSTCESRTINYLTHSLASVCLRQNRTFRTGVDAPDPTSIEKIDAAHGKTTDDAATVTPTLSLLVPTPAVSEVGRSAGGDIDPDSALDDASFLSFEDWKKQTLEKEGAEAVILSKRKKAESAQNHLEGLAEGADLDIDFGAFLGERPGEPVRTGAEDEDAYFSPTQSQPSREEQIERPRYRSKDAGKTCKERFNFASLDAGGQIMKSNTEVQSASAILRENRDVYMLNECRAKNKFFIVELSESILVETVALANFEFFSSTFRQFRISVSHSYPVKLDRWVDLGTFEAKNSRDIQAFLMDDPRIWARYLRVEFLSHYGNEFYCPVSLIRVHGRTMIQDVLNMEQGVRGEDDEDDDQEGLKEGEDEVLIPEAIAESVKKEARIAESFKEAKEAIEYLVSTAEDMVGGNVTKSPKSSQIVKQSLEDIALTTPWREIYLFHRFENDATEDICLVSDSPERLAASSHDLSNVTSTPNPEDNLSTSANSTYSLASAQNINSSTSLESPYANLTTLDLSDETPTRGTMTTNSNPTTTPLAANTPISRFSNATDTLSTTAKTSVTTSAHLSQPTTQESFFKNVSKRLQLLEANSTLSLKYIEEQSRILRDAFNKIEKRQLNKTTSFLENLNATVLEELRQFGKQYDQIWQSTVMELETHREQYQREQAAIASRLNLLADEIVFQKRMSIIQSILILLCLVAVVFSRTTSKSSPLNLVQKSLPESPYALDYAYVSPPDSPEPEGDWSSDLGRSYHQRQRSDESMHSILSRIQEGSPPTPLSNYSGHEEEAQGPGSQRRGKSTGLFDYTKIVRYQQEPAPSPNDETHRPSTPPDFLVADKASPVTSTSLAENDPVTMMATQQYRPPSSVAGGSNPVVLEKSLPPDTYTDPDQIGIAVTAPYTPHPPQDTKLSHRFGMARKPLPALPKDKDMEG